MAMTDGQLRELCERFFDAYEEHKIDEVMDTLADDFEVWLAPFDVIKQREEWLKSSVEGWTRQRRRIYTDRHIDTFDEGFLNRYTLCITEHNGRKSSLQVCVVALCRDGKIYRMDEYIDPSKSPAWQERQKQLKAQEAAAQNAAADETTTQIN